MMEPRTPVRQRPIWTAVPASALALAVQGVWLAWLAIVALAEQDDHAAVVAGWFVAPLVVFVFWLAAGALAAFPSPARRGALALEAVVVVVVALNLGDGQVGLALSAVGSCVAPAGLLALALWLDRR